MKRRYLCLVVAALVMLAACSKDKESERFRFLTGNIWESEELLVDGQDESGGLLSFLAGEARFNKDGTGSFGDYAGTWYFSNNETQITIKTESLPVPLTLIVNELTGQKFKISTYFPIKLDPDNPNLIEITFRAKK